jgi:hypothetical protein
MAKGYPTNGASVHRREADLLAPPPRRRARHNPLRSRRSPWGAGPAGSPRGTIGFRDAAMHLEQLPGLPIALPRPVAGAARGSISFSQLSLKSAQTPWGPALPPGCGE